MSSHSKENPSTQVVADLEHVSAEEGSFVLQQLEVYNWGPFRGIHRAEFDSRGTAIIGPTGSGKTTLVDALMTLLVAQPRYNLASTGGHESDRTLLSYIRGVLGGDGADGFSEVARPGRTITGVAATYGNGDRTLRLAAVFWMEGPGNSADDLKRRWIFSLAEDQTLESWLKMLHEDGIRELQRVGRETANLRIFESKKAYLSHIRKFFDVGDNAFTLLNRAAGLKQLNSIDEIFRELVLDDRSAFERAMEVAAEFDNLAAIHAELETAKRQLDSLAPIREESDRYQQLQLHLERFKILKRIVPVYVAMIADGRWKAEEDRLTDLLLSQNEAYLEQKERIDQLQPIVDSLRESYLKLGGSLVGELEEKIVLLQRNVDQRKRNADQYRSLLSSFQLPTELKYEQFQSNQILLSEMQERRQKERDEQRTKTLRALSEVQEGERIERELDLELRRVSERPDSNIPIAFQDFRSALASELGVGDDNLPYLAELVEVLPNESRWRGAIERALGSERLRILVPEESMKRALHWINHRDNRLHVRLQSADRETGSGKGETDFKGDGFAKKLQFKNHALVDAAKRLIAKRDLHCVDSTEELHHTEYAITVEGMISGSRGKFEKQDQRRLHQDWMTGFNNRDQLAFLQQQLTEQRRSLEELTRIAQNLDGTLRQQEGELVGMARLLEIAFSEVDLPTAQEELERQSRRLAALLDPQSDVSAAKAEFEIQRAILEKERVRSEELLEEVIKLREKCNQADQERQRWLDRIGTGLNKEELSIATSSLRVDESTALIHLDREERRLIKKVEEDASELERKRSDLALQLVRRMEMAKRVDTGALVDVGSTLDDISYYLDRFKVLLEEALPEKRSRFLEYLNRSSDQGVTQLISSIEEEVDAIEHRIEELNLTLMKVDFRSGRYLQLQPQRMKDERLRTLEVAQRKVRAAALKDDGGESHYRALQEMVTILREAGENRRLASSKALLDPRFRLQFFVVEVDRQTGAMSPPRTGSQSGSGGEKELMASHILTASLSYALCPQAATRPLYSSVVLDEAFSKSSPSAATRIIEALRIFGLHPIFVTPNKEIGLLKQHTRRVICVQRPGKEASLASISWETLEKIAKPR